MSDSRGRTAEGNPNPIDVFVGKKLCFFRQRMMFSQEALARLIGITFQQLQKYERGTNRISASRLWDISVVLGVFPDDFFAGMEDAVANSSPRCLQGKIEESEIIDPMQSEETIELIAAFYKIKDRNIRQKMLFAMMAFSKTTWE